ncbi:PREDICTED: DEAD-box ATP-dependent RNA helicase 50 [Tarenaya hassleriana]|uniref:DEAD-box ATP-dependent RNA helicase 50 n=1 Tax=Tarenaya hassleriana TaxID=28532 RepID=UPI00053C855A|nr:PREDICTED: DEAD-box ATP-dependent RNA helicase 50 [Tarenaya hassleriana]
MLARAPPPSLTFPSRESLGNWRPILRLRRHGGAVVARAGYTRRPLESPGSYELVDHSTGDRVIVVGDDDKEDDFSSPDDALSSIPSEIPRNGSRSRGVAASFGRLKAQKVKALVGRASRKKQSVIHRDDEGEDTVSDNEEHFAEDSFGSSSILDYMRKKLVKGAITEQKEYVEPRKVERFVRPWEDREPKELSTLDGSDEAFEEASDSRRRTDIKGDEVQTSSGKGSASNSRGWGDRRSVATSRERPIEEKRGSKFISTSETDFFSRKAFRELGCSDYMIKSLKEQNFIRASHIQALAFAPVIEGKSCIVADQSGSGKTLAYLVPVIQRLREEEIQGQSKSSSRCPRVVVLVPTAELASQVLGNCRSLSRFGVPFRSMVVTGGFKQKTQLENLEQGVDVLIATPGRFMFLIKEGHLELTNLRCVVLDEVDILFGDEDFEVTLQSLINSSPVTAQYLFVTATLPLAIYNKLVEVFPDCEAVMGPRVHRVSPALEEVLVDCSGDDKAEKTPETAFVNKKAALLQIVEENPVPKTIIFCNKIETCRKVENILKRSDRKESQFRVLPFHAALAQESRLSNMKEFTSSQPEGSSLFMVCTDRASRGIDFSGVDHVVLFDFPRDPSEYVRRVGRTARGAGGKGKAFIFAVGKQVPLARKIVERNLKGHPLHDVPSAYEFTT